MSVLECDRTGCPHVMCERMVLDGSMYICSECFEELDEYRRTWTSPMSRAGVRQAIVDFMKTEPGTHSVLEGAVDVDAEFNRLVGRRED